MKCGETEIVNKKNSISIQSITVPIATNQPNNKEILSKFNLPIELNKFLTTLKSSSSILSNKDQSQALLIPIEEQNVLEEFNRNQELLTTILKQKVDLNSSTNKIETKYNNSKALDKLILNSV